MYPPSLHLILAVTLQVSTAVYGKNARRRDLDGGSLTIPVPPTLLSPHMGRPLADATQNERRDGVLEGLLMKRQTCQAGYGVCPNQTCCPLGGRCCNTYCCKAGYWCYGTGCCSTSEIGCEQVSCCPTGSNCCKGGGCCDAGNNCWITDSGKKGCCPVGKNCSDNASECATATYVKCAGENFCCPPGDECYRDSANNPKCRSPDDTITSTTTTDTITSTSTSTSTQVNTQVNVNTSPTTTFQTTTVVGRTTGTSTSTRSVTTLPSINGDNDSSSGGGGVGSDKLPPFFGANAALHVEQSLLTFVPLFVACFTSMLVL